MYKSLGDICRHNAYTQRRSQQEASIAEGKEEARWTREREREGAERKKLRRIEGGDRAASRENEVGRRRLGIYIPGRHFEPSAARLKSARRSLARGRYKDKLCSRRSDHSCHNSCLGRTNLALFLYGYSAPPPPPPPGNKDGSAYVQRPREAESSCPPWAGLTQMTLPRWQDGVARSPSLLLERRARESPLSLSLTCVKLDRLAAAAAARLSAVV